MRNSASSLDACFNRLPFFNGGVHGMERLPGEDVVGDGCDAVLISQSEAER